MTNKGKRPTDNYEERAHVALIQKSKALEMLLPGFFAEPGGRSDLLINTGTTFRQPA